MAIYHPTEDQIIGAGPRMGMFYRRSSAASTSVAFIAKVAAQHSAVPVTTYEVVQLIANSPWNQAHIAYGMAGYENYGFPGPQYKKSYSSNPTSGPSSGNSWPTLWIPTVDGKEPEAIFAAQPIPPVPPVPPTPSVNGENGFVAPSPDVAGFPWWLAFVGGSVILVGWLLKQSRRGRRPKRRRAR